MLCAKHPDMVYGVIQVRPYLTGEVYRPAVSAVNRVYESCPGVPCVNRVYRSLLAIPYDRLYGSYSKEF